MSLVWNIFRLKSFLVRNSDPIHNIGGWSVVCEVDCEIDTCLRVKSFPNFKSEGVWSIDSELCPAGRSLCLPSGFVHLRVLRSVDVGEL